MIVDLDRMTVSFGGERVRGGGPSLPKLLAILAGADQTGRAPLTRGEVMNFLDPGKPPDRAKFKRLGDYAERLFGARNPMRLLAGQCWLQSGYEPVEVYRGNDRLEGDAILDYFRSADVSDSVTLFWQRPSVEVLIVLVDADADFAKGHLDRARRKYLSILKSADELGLRGVAMTRLISVARRLEAYGELHRYAHRLKSLSLQVRHVDLQTFFDANAELALAWYDYSFKRNYDGALDRLGRIGSWCNRFTGLGSEWLNLNALATRRQSLAARAGADRTTAQQSIAFLENALAEAIAMNNPYQIQQSAANLANLLSLFGQHKHGRIVPSERASVEATQLLRLVSSVCASFGIGRDDLFGEIFILSHTRRYGLAGSDVSDLLGGAATLAEFANREFKRAATVGRAREQFELLCLEGCHAAALEGHLQYFVMFAAAIARDPDSVHPAFRRSQARFIEEIVSIALQQRRGEPAWTDAVAKLEATLEYIRAYRDHRRECRYPFRHPQRCRPALHRWSLFWCSLSAPQLTLANAYFRARKPRA